MLKINRSLLIYIIISFSVSLIVPFIIKIYLNSSLSFAIIVILTWTKLFLVLLNEILKIKLKLIPKIISYFYNFILIFLVIIYINLTPYSIFHYWLESTKNYTGGYVISNIFILVSIIFSYFFSAMIITKKSIKPLLLQLSFCAGVGAVIFTEVLLVLLALAILFLFILLYLKRPILIYIPLLILTAAVCLLILLFFPDFNSHSFLNRLFSYDFKTPINKLFPDFPIILEIPGHGYSFNPKELGGRALLSPVPLFYVYGVPEETIYLRKEMFISYEGRSWTNKKLSSAEPIMLAMGIEAPPVRQEGLRIRILSQPYYYFLHTLDTQRIIYKNNLLLLPNKSTWLGHIMKNPLEPGDELFLIFGENETQNPLTNKEQFLQVPETIPDAVLALAAELDSLNNDPLATLINITDYLSLNYQYSLEAPDLEEGEDFINRFLFQDKFGYCVHFSSAFVILARLNNIPARYVTGFIAYIPEEKEWTTVSGLSSHAWAEVWLADRGWVTWEPTTPFNILHGGIAAIPAQYNISADSYTRRQLSSVMEIELAEDNEPININIFQSLSQIFFNYISLIIFIIIIISFFIFLLLRHFIPLLFFNNRQRARIIIHKLARRKRNYPPPSLKGWLLWIHTLKKENKKAKPEANTLQELILKTLYNQYLPTKRDICFLIRMYRLVR